MVIAEIIITAVVALIVLLTVVRSVRIGGEDWSARAYMPDQSFEPGAQVEVVKIEGATALVYE